MTIQLRQSSCDPAMQGQLRPNKGVSLRLHHVRSPVSIFGWAQTVELVLAVEPDPTVAMAWFANEAIAEFGDLTAYDMLCKGMKDQLDHFLRDIIEGRREWVLAAEPRCVER
ncbi:hypothetical protein [Dyella sp. Tek66A03]|uniref:hypothetical protein n=1 Tax=Dyella sp. Tek66A03 TaxID=3458298 RepID=UPI00403EF4F6